MLLCEHVVIVVSNSEMDYLGQCGILCLKAALRSCGHFGQLLRERAFCQQHCYVKMWSLWSAYQREGYIGQYILLCFISCFVKMWSLWSVSQRGLSWATCSVMLKKLLREHVVIVVSLLEI